MNNQRLSSSPDPNSLKARFALRFIRSLRRIKMSTPTISSMPTLQKRSHMIKLAADASMASAVGTKWTWSRALLFKIRNRARIHVFDKQKKFNTGKNNKKNVTVLSEEVEKEMVKADELRRVVPGGESMDLFKLLEETAHYMKCLNTQVEVMQSIVDLYSPPTSLMG